MYTIQYVKANGELGMQSFDSRDRRKLAKHMARFECQIMNVFEQATVITKAMRDELKKCPVPLTREAREFAYSVSP